MSDEPEADAAERQPAAEFIEAIADSLAALDGLGRAEMHYEGARDRVVRLARGLVSDATLTDAEAVERAGELALGALRAALGG